MNDKNTTRISLIKAAKTEGKTDWAKVARDTGGGEDEDFDWTNARISMPVGKKLISLRVDEDVLDFFKEQGKGYQTRINSVLRSYMKAHSA